MHPSTLPSSIGAGRKPTGTGHRRHPRQGPAANWACFLSRRYIVSRHPDASPSGSPAQHYTSVDASQALEDARAVLEAVDAAWQDVTAP